MQLSQEDRYTLFQLHDMRERAFKLLQMLNRECQFAQIKHDIQNQTREELDQQQREYFLHQQIKNIQTELGEDGNSDVAEIERKAEKLTFPDKVKELFKREVENSSASTSSRPTTMCSSTTCKRLWRCHGASTPRTI